MKADSTFLNSEHFCNAMYVHTAKGRAGAAATRIDTNRCICVFLAEHTRRLPWHRQDAVSRLCLGCREVIERQGAAGAIQGWHSRRCVQPCNEKFRGEAIIIIWHILCVRQQGQAPFWSRSKTCRATKVASAISS